MIQRTSIAIDKRKSADFLEFIKANAKNKSFWKDIKKTASSEVSKDDLEKLFKKENYKNNI